MNHFPKILSIDKPLVKNIFNGEVEVTEKVDGSQLCFVTIGNIVYIRSKNLQFYPLDSCDSQEKHAAYKHFKKGADYILSIKDNLLEKVEYYCEFLKKPKHNKLKYHRVPKNNLMLFGLYDLKNKEFYNYSILEIEAKVLDIEVVPLLYKGITNQESLMKLLEKESVLGGCKVEGLVIKNYSLTTKYQDVPGIMVVKLVSEAFKEVVHKPRVKSTLLTICQAYRTNARWDKAIQHLKEGGELKGDQSDIGLIIREIKEDIIKEEGLEEAKEKFVKFLLKISAEGFAEYYKEKLKEK